MASLPVPNTTVDVLDKSGQFSLPWRRFFQSLAPVGTGGGGGTPGPEGPPGPAGHTGPAGPAGPAGSSDFLEFSRLDTDQPGLDPLSLVNASQQDLMLLAGSGITLTPNPAYGGPVTIAASGGGTVTSITASTGITLSPNPITATGSVAISNTGVVAGTYGDGTHVGQFTVNQQGQLTSAASVTITGAAVNTNWFPLVSGTEPPNWITDGAGNPIAIAFTGT